MNYGISAVISDARISMCFEMVTNSKYSIFIYADPNSAVDGESRCSQNSLELFDCAICNQNVPSTEQQPVGYVAFLQSGTGK